jgi:hypothetical protein
VLNRILENSTKKLEVWKNKKKEWFKKQGVPKKQSLLLKK